MHIKIIGMGWFKFNNQHLNEQNPSQMLSTLCKHQNLPHLSESVLDFFQLMLNPAHTRKSNKANVVDF